MLRQTLLRSARLGLILSLASTLAFAQDRPAHINKAYCAQNLFEANQAADSAKSSFNAAVGAGAVLGCTALSILVLGLDGGVMSAVCAVIAAGGTGGLQEAATQAARDAFNERRDPRCVAI